MAYAVIGPFVTGNILTAATMTQVRDNEEFLIEPPACSIYNSANLSVPDTTGTVLSCNSEFYDPGSMHSTTTNTSRITIATPGKYAVEATIKFQANATGFRNGKFRVNGSTILESMQVAAGGASRSTVLTCARKVVMAAGDYVEVMVEHTAGVNLDVELYEFSASFVMR